MYKKNCKKVELTGQTVIMILNNNFIAQLGSSWSNRPLLAELVKFSNYYPYRKIGHQSSPSSMRLIWNFALTYYYIVNLKEVLPLL